ncbi:hypothetical protein CFIMG_008302RA00001 [Ceratocystis fimbriata CBS 114723]|uniref:Zn(2)-C6 fungal-type domain-containing protein n=1 Tax=Ceratocystis fimbriata CBS 114723 TaxID=1035309 RepID=A0A2C5X4L0_9PEZI|nr:hypothetical protein CFIMG_008302RA00001 [Ceratocystis fimbriata CBS 114723]
MTAAISFPIASPAPPTATTKATPTPTAIPTATAACKRRRRRRRPAPLGRGASDDCFACAKKNLVCDRRRPYCEQCLDAGTECSGYKTRLTWGVGVASRGKLRGLSLPVAKTKAEVQTEQQRIPAVKHEESTAASSSAPGSGLAPGFVYDSLPTPESIEALMMSWGWQEEQQYQNQPQTQFQPDSRSHSPYHVQCPPSPVIFQDGYTSHNPFSAPRLSVSSSCSSYLSVSPSTCTFPPTPLSSSLSSSSLPGSASFAAAYSPTVAYGSANSGSASMMADSGVDMAEAMLEAKMLEGCGDLPLQLRMSLGQTSELVPADLYGPLGGLGNYTDFGGLIMDDQHLVSSLDAIGRTQTESRVYTQPQPRPRCYPTDHAYYMG